MDSHTSVGQSMNSAARIRARAGRLLGALLVFTAIVLATAAGASATTRATKPAAELPAYENVRYGPSPFEVANVYPAVEAGAPIVVMVHGGGWRKQGILGRLENEARTLQREGSTVVEINYDQDSLLAPAFPIEPNDVAAATRWAIANAASFNADPSTVILLGGSAGGNLVAIVAEQLDAASPGTVDAVISLSGPMDFVSLWPKLEGDTIANESFNKSVHWALGMSTDELPFPTAYAQQWSPALHVPRSGCPAWLIFNSEAETIPLAQAQEMNSNLRAAGCSATLGVVPGSEHAFAYFHRVRPAIVDFIKAQ